MTGRGEGMRLNQYIASCGICSRREADRLIEEVRVYVDGIPAIPGMRVTGQERIEVNGKLIRGRQETTVVAWYKPVGVTCTERDPHAERTIRDAFKYPIRLTYAGRLDKDSEGLLLMTDDGKLIDAMIDEDASYVTLIYGLGADEGQAHEIEKYITDKYQLDCGVSSGGQDIYPFIIGVE